MPASAKQKRVYRARSPRKTTAIVAKGKSTVSFKSDILTHEIMKALRDPDTYTHDKERGLAEHTHTFLQNAKGSIILSIKPLENEGWETVLSALSTLGDGCIDTYIATLAIAHEHNGTDQIREPFHISPDDILEVCGKKKSHGSYNPGQRAEVMKHLKTLSQARVIATLTGNPCAPKKRGPKRKGAGTSDPTVMSAEGALIDFLSFKIGEYSTITGEEVWEKRRIAIGEWVTMIPHFCNQTAIMLRQVLAFSAKNERYQKRLGLYLTFMFRINAKNGGVFKCSLAALLEGAGIVVPRERGQFKEAIEYALQVLKRENVMSNYEQIVGAGPAWQLIQKEIHERARGWWEKYAAIEWRFSSPDYAREQYRNLLKASTERMKDTNN